MHRSTVIMKIHLVHFSKASDRKKIANSREKQDGNPVDGQDIKGMAGKKQDPGILVNA